MLADLAPGARLPSRPPSAGACFSAAPAHSTVRSYLFPVVRDGNRRPRARYPSERRRPAGRRQAGFQARPAGCARRCLVVVRTPRPIARTLSTKLTLLDPAISEVPTQTHPDWAVDHVEPEELVGDHRVTDVPLRREVTDEDGECSSPLTPVSPSHRWVNSWSRVKDQAPR